MYVGEIRQESSVTYGIVAHCVLSVIAIRLYVSNSIWLIWWWNNARAQMQSVYLCIHFARFSIYYVIISIILLVSTVVIGDFIAKNVCFWFFDFEMHTHL